MTEWNTFPSATVMSVSNAVCGEEMVAPAVELVI